MLNDVDRKLNSDAQMTIAKMVAGLPEEPVSMVWRSGLNEALLANCVKAKKKRWLVNFVSPVAGLSVACLLAVVVLLVPPKARPTSDAFPQTSVAKDSGSDSVEAALVRMHQDDVRVQDVAGSGLSPAEATNNVSANPHNDTDDLEEDIQL